MSPNTWHRLASYVIVFGARRNPICQALDTRTILVSIVDFVGLALHMRFIDGKKNRYKNRKLPA